MQFKEPKDDGKYQWTNHVKDKMQYYGISESLVKRIVRFPKRIEEGIALGTNAAMQPKPGKKNPSETWVMYQEIRPRRRGVKQSQKEKNDAMLTATKKRIISAWRYPGVSPKRKGIPIPDEILQELENIV